MRRLVCFVLALVAAPQVAFAAGAQLSIQQIQLDEKRWPRARAYVNVVGASGSPIQGLGPDLFRIYEGGAASGTKVLKVDTLETAGTGASILVVLQASGAMEPIAEELKKAVSAFVNSLGDKDVVGCISYGETTDVVAPLAADKGEVAGKCNKIAFTGKSFLLFDGLAQAISVMTAPGKTGTTLPAPRAIVVIADGRDNGSATDIEKVISDANRRRIPIHAVGHSELDQDSLAQLEQLARRTGGTYRPATAALDITKGLTVIHDFINKAYVLEWKTDLPHDGKDHKLEIAMESESGAALKGAITVRTPDFFDWIKLGIWVAAILLLAIVAGVIWFVTRPKPPPTRFCPVCKRVQMPEWDVCLFCLKGAKAKLLVQKGIDKGKQYPLVGKMVAIGSGPENSIRLIDGAVSGKHAGVSIDDNKFEIVDLGSKNGVLVNGRRTPRRFLRNGDVITLGMTELKFESSISTGSDEEAEA
jgi:Inner membrane component of T3SS, cytoplasmic domain/von Willebrand factor type A domain